MAFPASVVHCQSLVKTFGRVRALDGLDLDVRRGEVHGFLGPNGAGKSTTIRILLGLMKATGGRVEVFGEDPWREAPKLHARLAYVAGDVSLWPGLTGGQCLDVLATAQGATRRSRIDALVERFDLDPGKRVRDYSKGNRQKVALIAALAADAELLVLDEPTSGLDPLMEQVFQQCVQERRLEGATILLSSHILAEVEALADRVSIVRRGRTLRTATLADLQRQTQTTVHAITLSQPDGLASCRGVTEHVSERRDGCVDSRFSVTPDCIDAAIGLLHRAHISSLTVTPPTLDTLFLRNYAEPAAAGLADRLPGKANRAGAAR
jgi:polyether ionophore transport system ATP-binding protein